MKHIIKWRWAVIIFWLIATVLLTVLTPNLQALVAEKGQITVPDNYRSVEADALLQELSGDEATTHDLVLVFHENDGLTDEDKKDIQM